jgi:hypothetical protein
MQKAGDPVYVDEELKWNFYFNDSIDKTKNNHQTLRELLTGFFEFFSKINPKEFVLSLHTGKLIKYEEFSKDPELSEARKLIESLDEPPFKFSFFNVQDGFELNYNIGLKESKTSYEFFELLKFSHQKCEELKDEKFNDFLVKLFTEVKLPKVEKKAKEERRIERKLKYEEKKKQLEELKKTENGNVKVTELSLYYF